MAPKSIIHIFCLLALISTASAQSKEQTAESFGTAFRPIETHFRLAAKHLPRHLVRAGAKRSEYEYDMVAVDQLLVQTKKDTLSHIPEDALPVRDYVERVIPSGFPYVE